jgi:Cholesterol-capturing domain.
MFLMQWTSANQPVFQVLLVLISFVLSWGEAWFLDFRVLPQELQAMDLLQGKKFERLIGTVKDKVICFGLLEDMPGRSL